MRENLVTYLDDFRRRDRQIAIVRHQGNRRRQTTYGELARMAGRFAAQLEELEIGAGERVLLWGENSAEWMAAFFGCVLRGVLAVPLDASGATDFAARVATDVSPRLAVGDAALIEQLPAEIPRLRFEDWPQALPGREAVAVAGLTRETPLQILFTSGTTGEPKGVVITHGNVLASVGPIEEGAKPYLRYERLVHPLRILHTLPLSHVFGQTMGLWIPPILSAEVHFEGRLVASRLIETIRRERISVLAAVPRVLALLKAHLETQYPELAGQIEAARSLKALGRWWRFRRIHRDFGWKFWALVSGGGALAGSLEQFWNTLGLVLVQGYGMTETTALITLNHPFHVSRGTIGKPLAGREVKLGADGEVLVRGASIATANWSGGKLHQRQEEWLATGDLAAADAGGALRFIGRKSEVIVTAAGMNIHPEDIESAIEAQPVVSGCAVVALETEQGPEPFAVLTCRGTKEQAAAAIEAANARLAEFQRVRRWALWPEPDLPRTSTGKVRRRVVADWLRNEQATATAALKAGETSLVPSDWLLGLISQISGEVPTETNDNSRLSEDLKLDSLGRIQLAAELEHRLGIVAEQGLLDQVETLGQLRKLLAGEAAPSAERSNAAPDASTQAEPSAIRAMAGLAGETTECEGHKRFVYPGWPWSMPLFILRAAFIEAVLRPLVWLLAGPCIAPQDQAATEALTAALPLLIIANHVTAFDMPLIQYALPGRLRRRMAVAMSGEMLEDYRHFRNPERKSNKAGFYLPGPAIYLLITALFNAFPLPRRRDFQLSFAHAGRALDRGFSVLVFPEGTRSTNGELGRFRPGIGLLTRQCGAAVLPVALKGLGELKSGRKQWFRSGAIEVRVGRPLRFTSVDTEMQITARLHQEVEELLKGEVSDSVC